MDAEDFSVIADEILNLVKNLQSRVSVLEKKSAKFVENKTFYDNLEEIKNRLSYIEEKIDKINSLIDKDTIDNIKDVNNLKIKLEVLENEYKSLIKDSDFLEIKTELMKLEKRVKQLEEYDKIDEIVSEINGIKNTLNSLSNDVETLKLKYVEKDNFEKLGKDVEALNKSIKEMENKLKQLVSDILNINERIDEIESDKISNIEEGVSKAFNELKSDVENIKKNISKVNVLNSLDEKDIERIRNLKSYEELYGKIINLENRVSSVISSLYVLENEIKNVINEGYGKYSDKIRSIEDHVSSVEKLANTVKAIVEDVKKEIEDVRDVMVYLGKENDKLNNKIRELENKLKILNIDELYDTLERIKLLEMDIENIKRELSSRSEEKERIKNMEYALRKLYERQNEILESLKKRL